MLYIRVSVYLFVVSLGVASAFSPGIGFFPRPLAQQTSNRGPRCTQLALKATAASSALSEDSRFRHLPLASSAVQPAKQQQQRPALWRVVWSFAAKMAGMIATALVLLSTAPSMCNAAASSSLAGTKGPEVVLVGQAILKDTEGEAPEFKRMTMKELLAYKPDHEDEETAKFVKKLDHKHVGDYVVGFLLKFVMPVTLLWMFIYLFINNQ